MTDEEVEAEKKLIAVIHSSHTEKQLLSALEFARLFVAKFGRGDNYVTDICDLLRLLRGEK